LSVPTSTTRRSSDLLLRHFHGSDLAHSLLPLLLFFQQLALPRNITAVTFCNHILPDRADGFTCDDLLSDRGLYGHLKHVARDQLDRKSTRLKSSHEN